MEESRESKIWQRVRGGVDPAEELRECLQKQGALLGIYRGLSRRGGRGRQLYEQKSSQIACLRGLLRVMTGQSVAPPRSPDAPADLLRCHRAELEFLGQLRCWSKEGELAALFDALTDRQKCQCRLVLELLGTM
ncbi:MAG: hypothetical protein IJA49_06760 [Oscillospiraceae bacterium]|nr:hypothetical protein [Oscillospiraceae bacterium]